MLHSLRRFSRDEVAQERHRILGFYDTYGERATKEAFGVDRKLIHVWKKRLKAHDGHLEALIPPFDKADKGQKDAHRSPDYRMDQADKAGAPQDGQREAQALC